MCDKKQKSLIAYMLEDGQSTMRALKINGFAIGSDEQPLALCDVSGVLRGWGVIATAFNGKMCFVCLNDPATAASLTLQPSGEEATPIELTPALAHTVVDKCVLDELPIGIV